MTYGYACTLVKDERLRRADVVKVRADSGEQAHDLASRLLALVDREVRRLEHTKARTPVNTGAAIAAAKLAREAHALARSAAEADNPKRAKAGDAPAQAKPRGLAARIAAERETEQQDLPHSNHGESSAPRAEQSDDIPNVVEGGAVRLRPGSIAARLDAVPAAAADPAA